MLLPGLVAGFLVCQALAAWNYTAFRRAYDHTTKSPRLFHYLWAMFISGVLVSALFIQYLIRVAYFGDLVYLVRNLMAVALIYLAVSFWILDRVVRNENAASETDPPTTQSDTEQFEVPDAHEADTPTEQESSNSEPKPEDVSLPLKESDFLKLVVAGVIGALAAAGIGVAFSPPVTIAIAAGAITASLAALTADYPRFAAAGGIYLFAATVVFGGLADRLPAIYSEDAFVSMFLFALLALVIVAIQEAGQAVLRRLFGENADAIVAVYRSITAAIAVVLTLLAGERLWRKAAHYGGIGVGGPVFAGMDILGIDLPAPLFFADGVDAAVVGFVAVLTAAFFTLDSLYATWHAAKYGASAAASSAKKGMDAASQAASAGSEYVEEKRSE